MWEFFEKRDINEIPKEQTEVPGSEITSEAKRKLEEPEFKQESKCRNQDLSSPEEDQKKKLDLSSDASLRERTESPEVRSPEDKLVSPKTEPGEMSAADPRDQVVDYIMNSDLPVSDKKELLRQYRSDLLSSQQVAPESISDPAENGAPVKVLRKGMGDVGISHHDYLDELGNLDKGIQNWQDYQQELADEINNLDDQIRSDPNLSETERRAQLGQNADRRALASEQYDRELSEMMAERAGLLENLQGMNPAEERIPSFYAPDGMSPEYGESLRPYEMPEGSRMVDSARIDMSSALGMDDPNFWNHHRRGKEDYMTLAGHLPEVQDRLDAGESLVSLMRDPELGPTACQYYSPDNMIRLSEKPNGEYAYTGEGRHRIQAAKELGYDIPALIEPDEYQS